MGIYIKGMEMPPNCCQCPVNIEVCKRGYEYLLAHPKLYDTRADDCPLIPIPPHGRLIDADILTVEHGWLDNFDNTHTHIQFVYANEIHRTPTIIEAEEGEQ